MGSDASFTCVLILSVHVMRIFVTLRPEPKWTPLAVRAYGEKMRLKSAAKAKRLQEAERGQPTFKKLVAVVTRWGTPSTLDNFAPPSDLLWQVQVLHEDGPGGLGSFHSQLLGTLQQALLQHPDTNARDARGLRRNAKVIVLNGAPYPDGSDPGCHTEWLPTMYVAGPTPYAALEVVRLVMEQKVRQGLLSQVPPKLCVAWQSQFGKPAAEPLPAPWREMHGDLRFYNQQFDVQPPEAPRVRRHLKGYFQQTSTKPPKMQLILDEGIAAFKDAVIPLRAPNPRFPNFLARILDNLGMGDGGKERLTYLLERVLGGRPVQLDFINIPAGRASDAFKSWLQEQPSVALLT